MNDQRLHDLIEDAVADIEPADRLSAIRARTRPSPRRYWIPAGAALVAASVVTALALTGRPAQEAVDPGPADSPSPTQSTGTEPPAPGPTVTPLPPETRAVAVYYIGATPDGPRLYREFASVPADDALTSALALAFGGPPQDADYRTGWPAVDGTFLGAEVVDDVIRVEIGDPELLLEHDPPLAQNAMAIEQVIYTAQAAVQERLPVQFVHAGNPVSEVLGIPTAEPLVEGPALETLAHVSITEPSEGLLVDNDEPFTVTGVGNSFEGNIVTRIQRVGGTEIVDELPTIAGTYEDRLFPFEVTFDLTDVAPGDYVVISRTDDPSGQGRFHTDSRLITVVD